MYTLITQLDYMYSTITCYKNGYIDSIFICSSFVAMVNLLDPHLHSVEGSQHGAIFPVRSKGSN